MGKVIEVQFRPNDERKPKDVLKAAKGANLQEALVIGREADGNFFFACTTNDPALALWMIEVSKRALLEGQLDGSDHE